MAQGFHVDGTFDLPSARRLSQALLTAPLDAELYVDFSQVHDFRDNAIAVLSRTLGELGTRVTVGGLTQHQHRLLRYFGAPAATIGPER